MHKIYTILSFLLLFLLSGHLQAQQKRTVDFIGGARSYTTENRIVVKDSLPDTTTVKRNTGGYALIDLGFDIKPNKSTEIIGMFRIRNQYGGFWGSGVSFDVRQLSLKGVISNAVRYQLGDLNIKQTPFTLYNHRADELDSLPGIFKFQNDIIAYEKFYQNNTWRQQGAHVDFGFTFSNLIKEANVKAYLTRLQASNFTTIPDRLMGGVTVDVLQSEHLGVAYNNFSVFDLKNTIPDSNMYQNQVNTVQLMWQDKFKNMPVEVKVEAGKSRAEASQFVAQSLLKDYFIHAYGQIKLPVQHLKFVLGYLNVGPDFRSIGAQSKNINYEAQSGFYNRYANQQLSRPLSIMDIVRNDNLYTSGVSTRLMATSPLYNNVTPYGIATFNRIGAYAKAVYDNEKGIAGSLVHYNLSEIRGQGTLKLKHFSQTKANMKFDIHKMAGLKKMLSVSMGGDWQTTNRGAAADVDHVKLNTAIINAGLEVEVAPKIDLMAGWIQARTHGNEFADERNTYTVVEYFSNTKYDLTQQMAAFGARCRFTERIYLSAFYQYSTYGDKLKISPDYQLNQFTLLYNMTF